MPSKQSATRRVVAPITIRDQLLTFFKRAIDEGRYQDGERLPSRRALTTDWGVSLGTINGVFEDLRRAGYVKAVMGSGTTAVGPRSRIPAA